jgi:hypothetical protein
MRPSSTELLQSVAEALERQVLPSVADKWAASTLRSAMQLLRHVALRIEREPALLRQQAADLAAALTRTHAALSAAGPSAPGLAALHNELARVLSEPMVAPDDLAMLDRRVEALLAAAESVIAARDVVRAATGSSAVHDALVEALSGQLARELPMIEPFQSTPPI